MQRGFTHFLVILAAATVLIVGFVAFMFLGSMSNKLSTVPSQMPSGEEEISDKDDLDTLEAEINATVVGEVESDLKTIENQGASL